MTAVEQWLGRNDAGIRVTDDYDRINEVYREHGWTDGLPIVPPTAERIERMLAYCDRPWDEPVAAVPPRAGEATPLRIATNAVMAGCRPEYFPLLVHAIEAMCEPRFNLYGMQTTTHLATPLIIVNGPIARELGINCGHNAFGPGTQSNATIGRAISLVLRNIGGAMPGSTDMCTFGSPAKYSYCVAENEAASPWEPLHVELGFPAEASTVTLVAAECPHNINDHQSLTAEGILTTIAGTVATTGSNDIFYTRTSQPLVVMGPEHAATVAAGGFSKADAKRFLFEHARLPLGRFSTENIECRLKTNFPERYADGDMSAPVLMAQDPSYFMIVVLGGAGKHSASIPSFGITQPVTRAFKRRDGAFANSIAEFRQGRGRVSP